MDNQDINIAIAEACGWTQIKDEWLHWDGPPTKYFSGIENDPECIERQIRQEIPNYCNDLNAIHEAEMLFVDDHFNRSDYTWELQKIVLGRNAESVKGKTTFQIIHATARQRAEAFLRTLEKWVD
jgi:hypothetical protein